MKEVDFTSVTMEPDAMREVFGDATVKLPPGVSLHPDAPVDEELDWIEYNKRWRAWQVANGYRAGWRFGDASAYVRGKMYTAP